MHTINYSQPFCRIKAPAKAILCGEHAVVYGQDAIAISIGLFCQARIYRSSKQNAEANLYINDQHNLSLITANKKLLQLLRLGHAKHNNNNIQEVMKQSSSYNGSMLILMYKLSIFLKMQNIIWDQWILASHYDYTIEINSNIPIGKCLGSSAAYNSVLSSSLYVIFGKFQKQFVQNQNNKFKEVINLMSFQFQKIQHGNPSGIDNFVSINGGVVLFNKNKTPKYQKLINSKIKLKEQIKIFIIDSGIQKNTKKAVTKVRQLYDSNDKYKQYIKEIGQISCKIKELLEKNEEWIDEFLTLIKRNHDILVELGVSDYKIDEIVQKYTKKGLTIKITGSGMGGCVLAFSKQNFQSEDPTIISAPLEQEGLEIIFQEKQQIN